MSKNKKIIYGVLAAVLVVAAGMVIYKYLPEKTGPLIPRKESLTGCSSDEDCLIVEITNPCCSATASSSAPPDAICECACVRAINKKYKNKWQELDALTTSCEATCKPCVLDLTNSQAKCENNQCVVSAKPETYVANNEPIKEKILQKTNIEWELINIDTSKGLSVNLARAKPQTSSKDSPLNQEKAKETALGFLELLKEELGIKDIREVVVDKITASFVIAYHQDFNNIPVYYSFGQISMTNYGDIYGLKHSWYPNITAPTTPKISGSEVKQTARTHYKSESINFFEEPKLYILPPDKLVWLVKMAEPVHKDALLDALTGEVISEYDNIVNGN